MSPHDSPSTDDTLAQLYDLVSGLLADPPDEETIEALATGSLPDPEIAPNDRLEAGLEGLAEWAEGVEDPAAEADRLGAEFTSLFVGPRPQLQIHESYYDGDYLGQPLAAVTETFERLGVAPAPDLKEEADHAAVELAALRELTLEHPDRKREFLADHGDWFADLADDVTEATEEPFYAAIADVVAGLIAFDARREGIRQ
jgi:TorA maturation chaperone TorD